MSSVSAGGSVDRDSGGGFLSRAAAGETISLVSSSAAGRTRVIDEGRQWLCWVHLGGCNSPTGAHSRAMLAELHPAARFDLLRGT